MAKCIDFIYLGANCPSDGCPEYFFNHKSFFDNDDARRAFAKAMQTIERYSINQSYIPNASPLRTEAQIADFVKKMKHSVPDCHDVTTIYSSKHGKILYQKSVRFPRVEDTQGLVKKIKKALPFDLEKEKNRPIPSYFMYVQ
ncbi:MAG: hypothetical protein ACMXYK_05555 [Candidatus Woesearchaeota archaeon]